MNVIIEIRITALITILFLILFSTPTVAVDEDYFIPYTDNYGYEYDPETGTYVQKEPTATATPQSTQELAQQTNIETNITAQTRTTQVETGNQNDNASIQLPVLIGALLGILLISFVVARKFKRQET